MQIRGPQTPEHQFRPHAPTRRPPESATPAPVGLASLDPEVLGADGLLDLQRSAGNAATEELIDGARSPVLDLLASSSGSPLEENTRTEMETRMGHDFSDVRVHTGGAADASSRSVQAHAYTVGSDIVFAAGRYQPDSDSGRHLLAHELTHVVQQRSGPVSGTPAGGGIQLSDPADSFERAAEANAHSVMSQPYTDGDSAAIPDPAAPGGPAATAQRTGEEGFDEEEGSAVQTRRALQRSETDEEEGEDL